MWLNPKMEREIEELENIVLENLQQLSIITGVWQKTTSERNFLDGNSTARPHCPLVVAMTDLSSAALSSNYEELDLQMPVPGADGLAKADSMPCRQIHLPQC